MTPCCKVGVFHGLIERILMLLDEQMILMDKYSFKWIWRLRILSDTLKHKAIEWVLVSTYRKTELEVQKPSILKQTANRTRNSIKLCCNRWTKLLLVENLTKRAEKPSYDNLYANRIIGWLIGVRRFAFRWNRENSFSNNGPSGIRLVIVTLIVMVW